MTASTSKSRWPSKYVGRKDLQPRIKTLVRVDADPRFDRRAACGLRACRLFDEKGRDESRAAFTARRTAAGQVCAACPISNACLEWGTRNKLTGFMGGRELQRGKPVVAAERQQP